jgi:hypothetical protein
VTDEERHVYTGPGGIHGRELSGQARDFRTAPILSKHDRRDTHREEVLKRGVPRGIAVGVGIDEARGDDEARGVEPSANRYGVGLQETDERDPSVAHEYIGRARGHAGTVDQASAVNEQVIDGARCACPGPVR